MQETMKTETDEIKAENATPAEETKSAKSDKKKVKKFI